LPTNSTTTFFEAAGRKGGGQQREEGPKGGQSFDRKGENDKSCVENRNRASESQRVGLSDPTLSFYVRPKAGQERYARKSGRALNTEVKRLGKPQGKKKDLADLSDESEQATVSRQGEPLTIMDQQDSLTMRPDKKRKGGPE